jgi:hypothetical protein
MRWLGLVAAIALLATPAAADVKDASFTDASGARVLSESIVVNAAPADAWNAFATDAGFMKWAAPWAHITPGNGGMIEFAFAPNGKAGDAGNVRHRILVWLPAKLLIFTNEYLPPGPGPFDAGAFQAVRTMLNFEPAGDGRTTVTETVIGFGAGPKFDQLYAHLRDGNAEYLATLAKHFGGQ